MPISNQPSTCTFWALLPVEIWTIILDLTIHVPRLLDTACVGSTFAKYICRASQLYNDERAYRVSERQRLLLRGVCAPWRAWADSRKNRYITMVDRGIPPEAVQHAVRVPLLARKQNELVIRHHEPSRWHIIDARVHTSLHAVCFQYLCLHATKHPLLRRINLSLGRRMAVEELREVIDGLAAFKRLAYLSLDLRSVEKKGIPLGLLPTALPTDDTTTSDGTPAYTTTLPNVRILECSSDSRAPTTSTAPSSTTAPSTGFILNLPELEHFYFYGGIPGTRLEFDWLAPFALRRLTSLTLGVPRGTLEIAWGELPALEELVCMNFEPTLPAPLPRAHPLRRVWLFGPWSTATFDALTAGVDEGRGTNLREVHLRTMRWNGRGHPVCTSRGKRLGSSIAADGGRDRFCAKVDRFEELFGLRTLDWCGRTRGSACSNSTRKDFQDEPEVMDDMDDETSEVQFIHESPPESEALTRGWYGSLLRRLFNRD